MATKLGSDLAVGDIIDVLGGPRRITLLVPYTHPTLKLPDWQIAYSGPRKASAVSRGTWGITIEPQLSYEVI